MTTTPIEQLPSLRVGTVEFISPDRIEVQLDIESPDSVALNTGTPRSFPRINGYVMIPVDLGFVVGQVSWITIQRSPYPKRSGFQDFGLIDLPFPLRKMELQPVGTLVATEKGYKVGYVMWPLRTAVSGKQNTPGGATEIMEILGKEESLARIRKGIELLSK